MSDALSSTHLLPFSDTVKFVCARAAKINERHEKAPELTFNSILLALLASTEGETDWFHVFIKEADVDVDKIMGSKSIDQAALSTIAAQPITQEEMDTDYLKSPSGAPLFDEADRIARETLNTSETQLIHLRHLFAAYIYGPNPKRQPQLLSYRINRRAWSDSLLAHISAQYPSEYSAWYKIAGEVFGPAVPTTTTEQSAIRLGSDEGEYRLLSRSTGVQSILSIAAAIAARQDALANPPIVTADALFLASAAPLTASSRSSTVDRWARSWFEDYMSGHGLGLVREIADRYGVQITELGPIADAAGQARELPNWDLPTYSILDVASNLSERRIKSDGNEIQPRHLIGALIYEPGVALISDYARHGLDRRQMSFAFVQQISSSLPAEYERWREVHETTFPGDPGTTTPTGDEPAVTVDALPKSPPPFIDSDVWTTDDALGYEPYAYAIYKFLMDDRTKCPVTISVQAPWGGGKTSLMRMVQKWLDATAHQGAARPTRGRHGYMTLGDALRLIQGAAMTTPEAGEPSNVEKMEARDRLPPVPVEKPSERFTVWFNAWKYESTNQVWAGLATAIMEQVADRLPAAKREQFWLQLNIRRIDADKVREAFYTKILGYWWRTAIPWLAGIVSAMAIGAALFVTNRYFSWKFGVELFSGGTIVSIVVAVLSHKNAKERTEREPAEISLSKYLSVPDYNAELGFVHHVEADLRRVFDAIPGNFKPMVVFIDDLDRCSPANVSQVMEAINLFLAGEFPDCMFVIGMDTEMVAAALKSAHKDVADGLPEDLRIPIGWRFMDKFVQLPFVIPPPQESDLVEYALSLLSPTSTSTASGPSETRRDGVVQPAPSEQVPADAFAATAPSDSLSASHAGALRRSVDAEIDKLDDNDEELREILRGTTKTFSNPRDLKRFANAYRFHSFLMSAYRVQIGGDSGQTASPQQLKRWMIFSIKWPEVARWLRRYQASETGSGAVRNQVVTRNGLKILEDAGQACGTLTEWQEFASAKLSILLEPTPWLKNDELYAFFKDEALIPDGQRLSDGAGRGIW